MRCRLRAVRWRLDPPLRGRAPRRGPGGGRGRGWLLTALVALALAAGIVGWLQHQLRPLVQEDGAPLPELDWTQAVPVTAEPADPGSSWAVLTANTQ